MLVAADSDQCAGLVLVVRTAGARATAKKCDLGSNIAEGVLVYFYLQSLCDLLLASNVDRQYSRVIHRVRIASMLCSFTVLLVLNPRLLMLQ